MKILKLNIKYCDSFLFTRNKFELWSWILDLIVIAANKPFSNNLDNQL